MHVPEQHFWPVGQTIPQSRQFIWSLPWTFLQVPEQHFCPAGQTMPQLLQFIGSFWMFVHVPEQHFWSVVHLIRHCPQC